MRTITFAVALFAAAAQAEWVSLTESDFAATWTPVSGTWYSHEGKIIGLCSGGEPAVLLSNATYYDFELGVELVAEFGAAVAIRAHWLPDAPKKEGTLPLCGYLVSGSGIFDAASETGEALITLPVPGPIEPFGRSRPRDFVHVSAHANQVQASATEAKKNVASDYWQKGFQSPDWRQGTADESGKYIGGKIALIVTGDASEFRNIRVNDLGREGTWRPLFNGTDFTGWTIWGSEEWKVEDGIIIGRSGPKKSEGYLATEETFKDFRVRGSFKMLGEGNFGLFYHSTIAYNDEQYPVISGLQGEVAPGYPSPSGWVYESYKRGWLVEPDMTTYRAYALRPGEWNEIEIETQGNRVTTWVNGIQVLDLTDKDQQLTEGSFALQLHTGGTDGIQWKDLYVRE